MALLPLSLLVMEEAAQTWLGAASLLAISAAAGAAWHFRSLFHEAAEERRNKRDLIENLAEGIYRSSLDGKQLSANAALVKLNGYNSEAEQLEGVKNIATEWYVDPQRRDAFRAVLMEKGRVDGFVSEIFRHKTRERIWITESARLVRHRRTGQPLFYEGSVREITATVEKLAIEERFQKLTRQLPGVLFQMEIPDAGKPRMAYMSPGITRITGYGHGEHIARPGLFNSLILSADRPEYDRSSSEAVQLLSTWEVEFRIRARCGTEKWLRMMASPERAPGLLTWHGYVADVSTRKRQELEIEELAYFDPLTKLPNRRMFMKRLSALTREAGMRGALLFIDLDNFKTLNDTQGHDVGDAYLVQVAERLRACVDAADTVARLGGDEFVVILGVGRADAGHAMRHAITAAHRIVAALHYSFTLGPMSHVGSASVGVVAFEGGTVGPDELLKRADITMYQAKAAGRNGVALFDPSALDRETARYRLVQELRTAIAERQFVLHFQPQVDDERRLCGAEALVRWAHPARGLLEPEKFLPIAQQFGLAGELGRQVLELGVAVLGSWRSEPAASRLRIAFNLGLPVFSGDAVVSGIRGLIEQHGVDPALLTLELTESLTIKDGEQVAARMAELKVLGITLSLDEFGTGYSSLATLRRLPFGEIKMDGKFVADIETSEEGRSLVRTVLAMARLLNLRAVAEGVENIRQEAFLRAYGCNLLQGSLYAAPMAEADFLAYARQHRASAVKAGLLEALQAG